MIMYLDPLGIYAGVPSFFAFGSEDGVADALTFWPLLYIIPKLLFLRIGVPYCLGCMLGSLILKTSKYCPLRDSGSIHLFRPYGPLSYNFVFLGCWRTEILFRTILYYTILYYTILYYTILYYTILYYTILYYTILYYTILYYTVLYYTIMWPFSCRATGASSSASPRAS